MSRLATLVVALLLVTAGCTAAGTQSASSDGDIVRSNESVDSTAADSTRGEAAASTLSATATDAESATVPATDAGEESANADDTETTTEAQSSDDSDDESASADDDAPESDASASDSSTSDSDTSDDASSADDNPSAAASSDADTDGSASDGETADDDGAATTSSASALEAQTEPEPQTEWNVTVTTVADGDSLLVEFPDGRLEKVDLVGVDAPDGDYSEDDFEGMATEDGGEAWLDDWGGKATGFVSDEIGGRDVRIYVDSVADRRDDSGTLQVYVDDGDTATLNADLIERGYAEVADYSFSKKEAFEQEEENAYQGHNGLWRFNEPDPLADLPDSDEEETATETETETETEPEPKTEWTVTVTMAADGDSLLVEFPDGRLEKVDLVGVDAPDGDYTEDDYLGMATEEGGEAWLNDWGGRATSFVASEVEGREVRIYVDSVADRRDDSGTLQVYVDDGDTATLNADLIERGYAEVAEYQFSKKTEFEQEEENAYQGHNGLWRFYEPDPLADLPDSDEETSAEMVTETESETQTESVTATETETEVESATETETMTETATETAVETESDETATATAAESTPAETEAPANASASA
ncbi:thermonuclease family protein [Halogeometricum sp. S1BR25-6]|uniref:Thermonuclease family protein n=1 Tax=Halogeometricum salsisoli TaxID=2950536 RepID=A0ABU2GAN6_9EURY|nr:thermonuclease family protein [Halogeometricum sp. S1BR25-6]MDS0297809.1 thermonuclease family protein [Halogeometricum sp. S1BR25-6]